MKMTWQFSVGSKFEEIRWNGQPTGKKGIVKYLRDDAHERTYAHHEGRFHYHVEFDDGSFETYMSQNDMLHL